MVDLWIGAVIHALALPGRALEPQPQSASDAHADDSARATVIARLGKPQQHPDEGFIAPVRGVLGMALAEPLRIAAGWPLAGDLVRPVVSPGDSSMVNLPNEIYSLKGYWNGKFTAKIANASEFGVRPDLITASDHPGSWDSRISAKSSEKDSSSRVSTRLTIPNTPEAQKLVGQTVTIEIHGAIRYPAAQPGNSFTEKNTTLHHTVSFVPAPAGAGRIYSIVRATGTGGGTVLFLISSLLLIMDTARLRKIGNPVQVFVANS